MPLALQDILVEHERMPVTDVVELILADHRTFERLFRELRDSLGDRAEHQRELSGLLVAHAVAEEREVYPALRRYLDDSVIEHGSEEHLDGHQALLDLLESPEVGSAHWRARLDHLEETIAHHLDEEEQAILHQATRSVPEPVRTDLGRAFVRIRERELTADCGSPDRVREPVRALARD
ncbi:hemerythrin domain-containing protein [Saccharopolyspora erythraea]|nr:hemerythrin domain-containing protein [Saccharopolyspora erythraea]